MPAVWPAKDPNDVIDYGYNWAPLIEDVTDEILTLEATVLTGTVVVEQATIVPFVGGDQATVLWLSGGTGAEGSVRQRITTQKGRQIDQTFTFPIQDR